MSSDADEVEPEVPTGVRRGFASMQAEGEEHQDIHALWVRYKAEGQSSDRDKLVLTYAPLVKYVTGRINIQLPPTLDQSDLLSYGILGLMDAIERFEPERNLRFETYAVPRIRGAIIDELRNVDWVPRSVRSKAKKIDEASTAFFAENGRPPTNEEIAEATGFAVSEIRKTVQSFAQAHVGTLSGSGDEPGLGESIADKTPDNYVDSPDMEIENEASKYMLADAVRDLDPRDRLVVGLYYYEGLTLSEIGEVLDVTESRVSQIHTGALSKIRTTLSDLV